MTLRHKTCKFNLHTRDLMSYVNQKHVKVVHCFAERRLDASTTESSARCRHYRTWRGL